MKLISAIDIPVLKTIFIEIVPINLKNMRKKSRFHVFMNSIVEIIKIITVESIRYSNAI